MFSSMIVAPLPENESFRLQSLRGLRVLDTEPEPEFDALAQAASLLCETPISLISLVDAERQWFKAHVGIDARETPRDYAFCAHAILGDSLFEVPNAKQDARFAGNPLVTGAPEVVFYAGEPLRLRNGAQIGTLCVIDHKPRQLSEQQRAILKRLARAAEYALEGRRALLAERENAAIGARAAALLRHSVDAIIGIRRDGAIIQWNDPAERMFGYNAEEVLGRSIAILVPHERQHEVDDLFAQLQASPAGLTYDSVRLHKNGSRVSVSVSVIAEFDGTGHAVSAVKFLRDISERERASRELAESEMRFRTLADFSPHGVYYTDANGACTYTNPRWQEIYGMSLADSLGEGWAKTLHPDDRAAIYTEWQRTAEQRTEFDMKFRVLRPDGSVRHVHSRARPIVDTNDTITGFVGSVVDVTAEQRTERELQMERQRLANIIEGTNAGTWAWNVQTGAVQFNEQWARLIGYTLDELQPVSFQTWLAAADPADTPRVDALLQQHFRGETERYECEFQMRHRDGQWRWMLGRGRVLSWTADGKPEWMFGTNQDITARKLQEEALQTGQRQFRLLYETAPAMLVSIDAQGRVLTATDRWLRHAGYTREEAVGQAAVNFLADSARERTLNDVVPTLLREGRVSDVPLQLHRADGSTYDVLLSAVLERDLSGAIERVLVIMEDMTELLLRSAELQREHAARVQIEQRAKELRDLLNERSEMLNVLAHEVRQPLNNALAALQSATTVLRERSDANTRSASTDASTRLERAQLVMNQVLAGVDNTLAAASLLAGNMPATRADTDIDTWIAVTVADIAAAERARICVVRETAARTVAMDMGLMRLALRNVLSNALRLAPRDSAVTVRLLDSDAPLALLIDVEDAGPGIPAEIRARLFERGASSRSGGHGLGLYIVRRVMELHGGSVQVVHSDERGTVMRLVLKQG